MQKTKDLIEDQDKQKKNDLKDRKSSDEEHLLPGTRNVLRASHNMLGSTDELMELIKKKEKEIAKRKGGIK